MKKLKAALILDNLKLTKWQKAALKEASNLLDIKIILNCKNTNTKKHYFKNFLYYVLNIFTLQTPLTRRSEYVHSNEKIIDFHSIYSNNWQSIPQEISQKLIDESFDVIIKFGMSLLKIDENLEKIPVLSFHHGDPSKYRGRPSGFYELLFDEDKSGLIVQSLSNKLDGGEILAFAESKLVHHSYKKSAEQFYQVSEFLLKKALLNLIKNNSIKLNTDGKNYRLPSNLTVIRFLSILLNRKIKRVIYGLFFEKKWKVGTTQITLNLKNKNIIQGSNINELPIVSNYLFYADPFFSIDGNKIRVEALNKKNGLGDIIEFDLNDATNTKQLLSGSHYSYPFSFLLNGKENLLPEVSLHSSQYYFDLSDTQKEKAFLNGLENKRLADATLFKYDDIWYIFFGDDRLSNSVVHLWLSDSITGTFKAHPESPVSISPTSSRMAGRIFHTEQGIFRFSQNSNRDYGSAITISEITELSSSAYKEKICGSIQINNYFGPHSIDFNKEKGIALIDYYKNTFSLLAGFRRFLAILSKK